MEYLPGWEIRGESDAGPMEPGLYPWRLVLHTMEGGFDGGISTLTSRGVWPHLAYDPATRRKIQGVPFSHAAKALANKAGGVETNRHRAIQVELAGRAAETQDWPKEWLDNIAIDIVRPLHDAFGIGLHSPAFVGQEAGTIATANAPQRMSFADWIGFDGICGHQHVPENDHWDPGHIDIARIIATAGGSSSTIQTKAHDMVVLLPPYQNTVLAYVVVGNKMLRQLNSEPRNAFGIPVAAADFAVKNSVPLVAVTQEEWDRVVTDDANIVKRLAAWIAKLFPKKAERAGTP